MDPLICPDCNEDNPGSAMHCSKCGASLKSARSIQEYILVGIILGAIIGLFFGTFVHVRIAGRASLGMGIFGIIAFPVFESFVGAIGGLVGGKITKSGKIIKKDRGHLLVAFYFQ